MVFQFGVSILTPDPMPSLGIVSTPLLEVNPKLDFGSISTYWVGVSGKFVLLFPHCILGMTMFVSRVCVLCACGGGEGRHGGDSVR